MKRIVALAVLGLLGLGCGSGDLSQQDACKQMIEATCNYMNRCLGTTGLAMLGYKTAAECISGMEKTTCTSTEACDSGQTYHGDKAKACIDAFNAASCTSSTSTPAACDQVCQ